MGQGRGWCMFLLLPVHAKRLCSPAHRIKPYLGFGVLIGSAYFRPAESTV